MKSAADIASFVVNLATAVSAFAAVAAHARRSPWRVVLCFFTTLSNLLCAGASLAVAAFRLTGAVPQEVLVLKYVGTCAVGLTFLTVMVFLGPFVCGYKYALDGPGLWLHLICPVMAVASLLAWDKPDAPFGVVFLGMLPMLCYAALYLYKILQPEGKGWEDFYSFNRGGRWPLSGALMAAAAFLIALALWAL